MRAMDACNMVWSVGCDFDSDAPEWRGGWPRCGCSMHSRRVLACTLGVFKAPVPSGGSEARQQEAKRVSARLPGLRFHMRDEVEFPIIVDGDDEQLTHHDVNMRVD